jgi:hypothetical protein
MKKIIFIIILFPLLYASGKAQEINSKFNLDFEEIETNFPANWQGKNLGDTLNYRVCIDSTNVKSGKYSIAIEFMGDDASAKSILFVLPCNYDGEKITLSGYIKTENITEGYAGLWMQTVDEEYGF